MMEKNMKFQLKLKGYMVARIKAITIKLAINFMLSKLLAKAKIKKLSL